MNRKLSEPGSLVDLMPGSVSLLMAAAELTHCQFQGAGPGPGAEVPQDPPSPSLPGLCRVKPAHLPPARLPAKYNAARLNTAQSLLVQEVPGGDPEPRSQAQPPPQLGPSLAGTHRPLPELSPVAPAA